MKISISVMTAISLFAMAILGPVMAMNVGGADAEILCGGIKENRCDGDMYMKEVIPCSVVGSYFMGVYHPIECQIERIICYTDEYCNGCHQYYHSYDPNTVHLCTYSHTKVDVSGTLCPYSNVR